MSDEKSKLEKDTFSYKYIDFFSKTIDYIPYVNLEGKKLNATIGLQNIMITPTDISTSEPDYSDIAYSGTLGFHFSLYSWDDTQFDQFRISTGVVGPLSGTEYIQKYVHKLTGSEDPQGWDNQLDNHFIANLGYLKGYKSYTHNLNHNTRFEWFNSGFVDFGNYYIGLGAGTLVRIGQNMPHNFHALSTLMSIAETNQINFTSRNKNLGWAFNLGLYTNIAGYLYTLEASKDAGYNDVSTEGSMISGKISFDLYYEDLQVSLEIFPTRTSYDITDTNSWGRINFTWAMQ